MPLVSFPLGLTLDIEPLLRATGLIPLGSNSWYRALAMCHWSHFPWVVISSPIPLSPVLRCFYTEPLLPTTDPRPCDIFMVLLHATGSGPLVSLYWAIITRHWFHSAQIFVLKHCCTPFILTFSCLYYFEPLLHATGSVTFRSFIEPLLDSTGSIMLRSLHWTIAG